VSREDRDFASTASHDRFDASGPRDNKLFAEELAHFAADDRAELQRPRLISLRPDQPPLETRRAVSSRRQRQRKSC
jgi:lipopolysaccharide export system protein LptC